MSTNCKIIVTFPITDAQKTSIINFCKDKQLYEHYVAVRFVIGKNVALSISMFGRSPEIYIGIFDIMTKEIVNDVCFTDDEVESALYYLEDKYAWATTRKPPIANAELVVAWVKYINNEDANTNQTEILIP